MKPVYLDPHQSKKGTFWIIKCLFIWKVIGNNSNIVQN